jgi:predicted transcriptional regulator
MSRMSTAALRSSAPMSLRVDTQLRERLSALAQQNKRSSHALALEAIEKFVAESEATSLWNTQAQASWQHYQETGLHATGEEVTRWLASWGTDGELPAPIAHT